MRRPLAAIAAAAALVLPLAIGTPAAHADTTNPCNVSVTTSPSTVVFRSTKEVPLRVHVAYDESCVTTDDYAVEIQLLRHVGSKYVFAYDLGVDSPKHDYTDIGMYGDLGAGTFVWSLGVVTKADGSQYQLPDLKGVVTKYGTKTALKATRAKGKTTLTVTARHFWARGDETGEKGGFKAWSKSKVKLQERVGSKWKTVKKLTTNTKGVAKVTLKASKHKYRAVSGGTTTYVGSTSKTVTR